MTSLHNTQTNLHVFIVVVNSFFSSFPQSLSKTVPSVARWDCSCPASSTHSSSFQLLLLHNMLSHMRFIEVQTWTIKVTGGHHKTRNTRKTDSLMNGMLLQSQPRKTSFAHIARSVLGFTEYDRWTELTGP